METQEWREWVSMSPLTKKIPQFYQYGLQMSPLALTCLDAFPNHLVVGTNAGLVYLVHLPTYNITKLKCEEAASSILCIAAVSCIDDMVAAGCSKGCISIFQIPIPQEGSIPNVQGNGPNSKRFTINLHRTPLTALTWSKNGMLLYSGDTEGNVGVVKVDLQYCECIAQLLFKVDSKVVQLSYCHKLLAVSYEERCLIYNTMDESKIMVGKKPRIPPGQYGCTLVCLSEESGNDHVLYCSRPGQVWSANTEGNVLFTYVHKKSPENTSIPLLNEPSGAIRSNKLSFSLLYNLEGSTLVSQSETDLIIFNVSDTNVFWHCSSFNKLCDVAVCENTIFVLDNNRQIRCISTSRPTFGINTLFKGLSSSLHSPNQNLNRPTLSDIRMKVILPNKNLMDGIAKLGETFASKISELTTPNIISGDSGSLFRTNSNPSLSTTSGMRDFRAFAYMHTPYLMKELKNVNDSTSPTPIEQTIPASQLIASGQERSSELLVLPPPGKKKVKKRTDLCEKKLQIPVSDADELQPNSDEVFNEIDPLRNFNSDSRSYDDFKSNIEEKENLLAKVLDLNCLKMDHEVNDDSEVSLEGVNDFSEVSLEGENAFSYLIEDKNVDMSFNKDEVHTFTSKFEERLVKDNEVSDVDVLMKDSKEQVKCMSYGPPSGSSLVISSLEEYAAEVDHERRFVSNSENENKWGKSLPDINQIPNPESLPWEWMKYHLPIGISAMGTSGNAVYISGDNILLCCPNFFSCNNDVPAWTRKKLSLNIIWFHLSPKEGELLIVTDEGVLLKGWISNLLSPEPLMFEHIANDVVCIATDSEVLWTLKANGQVIAQVILSNGKKDNIEISVQGLEFQHLGCHSSVVWGLTNSGQIAYRMGIGPDKPTGDEWGLLITPDIGPVEAFHLGEFGFGWIVSKKGDFFALPFISSSYPMGKEGKWWQVGLSDSMLGGNEKSTLITTNGKGQLLVASRDSNNVFTHSIRSFTGHLWDLITCAAEEPFVCLIGEGMFNDYGVLYTITTKGFLYAIDPSSPIPDILPISLPKGELAISVSARPEALWIVTKKGNVYIRAGLMAASAIGSSWSKLDLRQIADIQLCHVNVNNEVVWAVDINGQVVFRQGPLSPPSGGLDPAWLTVDSKELPKRTVFWKVFVGNKYHMVWGIDTRCRIYVREAIFPELSTGTSWVHVPGILGNLISISNDRVFVVTVTHDVFERKGVTSTNYIGDFWQKVPRPPALLDLITVSVDNCLWGLDLQGRLWRHSVLSFAAVGPHALIPEVLVGDIGVKSDLDEWEII